MLVPNYQAGKDSAAGFKLDYKGEIVEESYMPLNTTRLPGRTYQDCSSRSPMRCSPSCRVASASTSSSNTGRPASPIAFRVLSAFTVDELTLPAQQDAAVGMFGGANWAPNMDNPQNKKFVAGL